MNKQEQANKTNVLLAVLRTAENNGHDFSINEGVDIIDYIHRSETTLCRLAEDQCNYPQYDEAKQDRTEKRIEKYIADVIGCKCYTQRDPRGYCVRLYLDDFHNVFDGETTGMNW